MQGKSTCFEHVQSYITGGRFLGAFSLCSCSWCVFVLGFFYLMIRPAKLFWIIRQCKVIHTSSLHKVSAMRNAVEKLGCYLLFQNRAVLVDEGISHLPLCFNLKQIKFLIFSQFSEMSYKILVSYLCQRHLKKIWSLGWSPEGIKRLRVKSQQRALHA